MVTAKILSPNDLRQTTLPVWLGVDYIEVEEEGIPLRSHCTIEWSEGLTEFFCQRKSAPVEARRRFLRLSTNCRGIAGEDV